MIEKIKKLYYAYGLKFYKSVVVNSLLVAGSYVIIMCGLIIALATNRGVRIYGIVVGTIAALCVLGLLAGKLAYLLLTFIKNRMEKKFEVDTTPKETEKREVVIKRNKEQNEKIRVGFYCDGGQYWPTFDGLYNLFTGDERFEVVVIAAPENHQGKIYQFDSIAFLEKKGIPYVEAYKDDKWLDYKELRLNYVFFNRHYGVRMPKEVSFVEAAKYSKLCYVPYALCPQVGAVENTLCRFNEMKVFDYLFVENNTMAKIYEKYKAKIADVRTEILSVGSPKLEYSLQQTSNYHEDDKKYKQVILYTPRWNFDEGTNSFYELKNYFFNLVRDNADIQYIFRPHPLMKRTVDDKIGNDVWDEFIGEFDKYENAYVDTEEDYSISFAKATVLVSDLSTMLFEFSVTGKPVLYMYKRELLNDFGHEAERGFYRCLGVDDADRTLKNLREGIDPLAEKRKEIVSQLYFCEGQSSLEKIRDCILSDYEAI